MTQTHPLTTPWAHLLTAPADPSRAFVVSRTTYGDIYAWAAGLRSQFASLGEDDAVCLCTEDKGLIAAAFIAALGGGPTLVLPHAFTTPILEDLQQTLRVTHLLTDMAPPFPEGMQPLRLQKGSSDPGDGLIGPDPDRPILKLFTGGSTAKSKVWSKTPRNLLGEALYLRETFRISPEDLILATVPPQHIYGLLFSVLLPLISGARVLGGAFAYPQEIIKALETTGATALVSLPLHYRALGENLPGRHHLRQAFSSAGMLDERDAIRFSDRTGLGITEVYGSTETGGIATRCRANGETAWTPLDPVAWRISQGHLCVQSDFISPELPLDTEGFFLTGDLAAEAEKGRFLLQGRADGIVKVGGKRVDLTEIRSKLLRIPDVQDAVVTSRSVNRGRENEIAALVVTSLEIQKIRHILSQVLETHAIPRRIRSAPAIPMTKTGKYDRDAIDHLLEGAGETL